MTGRKTIRTADDSPVRFHFDEEVVELIGGLFDSIGTEEFYPVLTDFLRHAANFDDIAIMCYRTGKPPRAPYTSLADSPPESLTAFVQGLYMQSPMYKMCRKGEGGLNVLRDIAPDDFFETDFYKNCMQPSKLLDEVGFVVPASEGISYLVSLGRTVELTEFSDEEIAALKRVTPIVEKAVLRHEDLTRPDGDVRQTAETGDRSQALLDRLGPESLTDREREVISYLVRGYSSKACARELDISPATERVHRKNIYEKLGVNSQSELLASVFDSLLS